MFSYLFSFDNFSSTIFIYIYIFINFFFNKHTIFYYIKLKLQQKDINKKKTLRKAAIFKKIVLNVKYQKNNTTTKTKQTITKTTKTPIEIHKDRKKT